jgi:hypothetical protein
MAITRRDWIKWFGGVVPAITLMACQNDSGGAHDAAIDAPEGTPTVDITGNHPHGLHAMVVSKADVDGGMDVTYHIKGMAFHDHTVIITAAQFAMLKAGTAVMQTSSLGDPNDDNHTHVVVTTDPVS